MIAEAFATLYQGFRAKPLHPWLYLWSRLWHFVDWRLWTLPRTERLKSMRQFTSRHFVVSLLALALMFPGAIVAGQKASGARPAPVAVQTVPPRAEDISTLDGIMKAFYETISGPAGQPRQWARDRTLYVPGIRFVSTGVKPDGAITANVMDHQAYVDAVNGDLVREGFFEREIHRVSSTFGNITHVFSTYESRLKEGGPVIARGVNSVELFYDGKRWWIAAATWDSERSDNPIPKELLP
jgi:hypothetical protein